ncbi:unnamed protein product [Amaranthus hypochondriacus]
MSETENQQQAMLMEQMKQMFKMFQELHKPDPPTLIPTEPILPDLKVAEKLNYHNYNMWCKMMQMALDCRGRLSHIIDDPPSVTEPTYKLWKQRDSIVRSWIISNIETDLINQFLDYTVAKELWQGIETLLSSGQDELQIYDLSCQANAVKQKGEPLEIYYGNLTTIWKEIDRRQPNPMIHTEDMAIFNRFIQKQRLFQFLAGINESFDKEKRDLLNQDPLPTVEMAYAMIRREISRRGIMTHTPSSGHEPSGIGTGLITKQKSHGSKPSQGSSNPSGNYISKSRPYREQIRRDEEDKSHLHCTHCGGSRHTKDGCFKIIGFPEWWDEHQARKKREGGRSEQRKPEDRKKWSSQAYLTEHPPLKEKEGNDSTGNMKGMTEEGKTANPSILLNHSPSLSFICMSKNLDCSKEFFVTHKNRPLEYSKGPSLTRVDIIKNHHTLCLESNATNKNHQIFCVESNATNNNKAQTNFNKGPIVLTCPQNHNIKNTSWIIDCGATDTMTYDPKDFISFGKITKPLIQTANGECVTVEGTGTIKINPNITLDNCLLVPNLSHKLLSVSQLTKKMHCNVLMDSNSCLIQDPQTGRTIGRGIEENGLYVVDEVSQKGCTALVRGSVEQQLWTWHRRLGHPSLGYLEHLFPYLRGSKLVFNCESCILAKSHKQTYYPSLSRSHEPFMIVHSDVWGPSPDEGASQFSYFVLFIDDCTRMSWVYFLKHKSEVFDVFVKFHTMIRTQFQKQIRILRSDNGKEYVNHKMDKFMSHHGLIHQTTCPNTPQQNGIAERKNRTLLNIARAIMIESSVPTSFWPEAIATANYVTNRLPTKSLSHKTPLETLTLYTDSLSLHNLPPKIFGCVVYVHLPKQSRTKLEPRAVKCVFVGYGTNQKGYRCFDPLTRHMYVTLDCDFNEETYYYHLRCQGEKVSDDLSWLIVNPDNIERDDTVVETTTEAHVQSPQPQPPTLSQGYNEVQLNDLSNNASNEDVDESIQDIPSTDASGDISREESSPKYKLPPRSTRGVPPKRYDPDYEAHRSKYPINAEMPSGMSASAKAFNAVLYSKHVPKSAKEALAKPEWKHAMEDEIEALEKNRTWEKCIIPKGKKIVGCRWVFTIKYKSDGTIERYKARLVAKGYTQTYGIDYSETFSPVAKIDTIRVLFSIAANKDWPLYQFDVKNAFLHGEIKEEVYMEAPPGFTKGFREGEGCRLRKALYGLKQSPRAWFGRFTIAMRKFGYHQSNSDHTLFLKRKGSSITCLIIYVDDMIITGNDEQEIQALKRKLFAEFEMKDLGLLKYFLGRSKKGIFICQRKYVLDLLAEVGMLDCKPAETPIVVNHGLRIVEGEAAANREQYQKLVGKLIYLSHTRPDIAYAVGIVSRFMHRPQVQHMEAVLRILRYLKGTPGKGIVFWRNGHLRLQAYTDADWAGDRDDRKSTSGYFTLVGGNLVTWKSKKQKVVALSSAEAEFRGIAKGVTEVLWLRKLLTELGFKPERSCELNCDNQAAISISENPVQHDRTKHVEVDRHFIKEKLENDIIHIPFVRSKQQIADILTKAVGIEQFQDTLSKLGVWDPTTQLEGE